MAAGNIKGNNNLLAWPHTLDRGTDFQDFAHGFVAQNVARPHAGNITVVQMKVGSADRRGRHFNYGIVRVDQVGKMDVFNFDGVLALPTECFHETGSP
jgi:hypothetical protein